MVLITSFIEHHKQNVANFPILGFGLEKQFKKWPNTSILVLSFNRNIQNLLGRARKH